MRTVATTREKNRASLNRDYRAALSHYVLRGGEEGLRRAYELGRVAIQEGRGLVDIASLHHQVLVALVVRENPTVRRAQMIRASTDFFLECLSPYEMVHRGFQDAVRALRRMNEMMEEEIKRIAYAVHDEAGQSLVAVRLSLADVSRGLPQTKQGNIRRVEALLDQAEAQLRRLSHELRPAILDDLGWIAALRFLAEGVSKRTGLLVRVKTAFSGRLPGAVETAIYRVVQEALTNAAKHARAAHVTIQVRRAGRAILCSIQDDGVGFDVSAVQSDPTRGLGLAGMKERLHAIGGALSVNSSSGRGTKLVIRVFLP
ncbi:MAG TPA: ATP-binding protein [Candidatus Acidoferrum sp.]|nr:ATP-binding protein [Candidatus Acidoferrum sp.]